MTGIHPIDFQKDPQEDFINLAKSYLEVELRLKFNNNGNIANDTLVNICNNLIHSLFKQINVRVKGLSSVLKQIPISTKPSLTLLLTMTKTMVKRY